MLYLKTVFFLICATIFVKSAKILGIFHFPSKSHHILGSSLLKALADRGHEVTMLSPFALDTPYPNYEDIQLTKLLEFKEDSITPILFQMQNLSYFNKMTTLLSKMDDFDTIFFRDSAVKELIESKRKFDIVITCWFGNDAYLTFAHQFDALSIAFSPAGSTPMSNMLTMNPTPFSYVPNLMLPFSSEMTFIQRILNTLAHVIAEISYYSFMSYKQDLLRKKHFPNSPSIKELQNNVSLVLLNSHYAIESPRPYVPNIVQVGGFHLKEPKKLQGDIKTFMDSAHNGVIFFSLGSNAKSSDMPNEKIESIIKCFSTLNLKVLWKWETDAKLDLPKNVKIGKWLPQTDILGHPNLKVFVTHGGLLSTTEAVYSGVPMVGIPLFGDQDSNVEDSVKKGYMVKVPYIELDDKTLCNAINEVLTNSKYQENIKQLSQILRDRPIKPMDNAVFWVEYVLRHKGAHHLKTTAIKLKWYQYYLLDVIGVLLGFLMLIIASCFFVIRKIYVLIKKSIFKSVKPIRKSNKKKKLK